MSDMSSSMATATAERETGGPRHRARPHARRLSLRRCVLLRQQMQQQQHTVPPQDPPEKPCDVRVYTLRFEEDPAETSPQPPKEGGLAHFLRNLFFGPSRSEEGCPSTPVPSALTRFGSFENLPQLSAPRPDDDPRGDVDGDDDQRGGGKLQKALRVTCLLKRASARDTLGDASARTVDRESDAPPVKRGRSTFFSCPVH